ncbi:MAG: hypothetical protein ACRDF9_14135, partial [Candidatus Limnocylindria bacterium]
MLTCYMCGETKPEAEFAFADIAKGTRQSHCRKCHATYRHGHYLANRDDYIRREVARMAGYRLANRPLLLGYHLDHHCVDCGEADPVVLDFDHRDPSTKRNEVARLATTKPWPQVLAEIAKCDVRCANCHRRKTAKQFGWHKLRRSATTFEKVISQPLLVQLEEVPLAVLADLAARICCTCGLAKPMSEFAVKNKQRGTRSTKCRSCQAAYSREHYRRNRPTYLRRAASKRKINREECRQQVFDYLVTHPCTDCGETDPIVLEFDHRDASLKRESISRMISKRTWPIV